MSKYRKSHCYFLRSMSIACSHAHTNMNKNNVATFWPISSVFNYLFCLYAMRMYEPMLWYARVSCSRQQRRPTPKPKYPKQMLWIFLYFGLPCKRVYHACMCLCVGREEQEWNWRSRRKYWIWVRTNCDYPTEIGIKACTSICMSGVCECLWQYQQWKLFRLYSTEGKESLFYGLLLQSKISIEVAN